MILRNRLYYSVKPFLPRPLRAFIRTGVATRLRKRAGHSWPIMPGSERPPSGWPGWPAGKQFALVLTHDVESQRGLDRCLQLAQLEEALGFHSSFNLIPEGNYRVPLELREALRDKGFEVGIHDLKHDGHLYRSRREFSRSAQRINHYVKDWNAAGFRSGFMLHNLEWLHDLDVAYDMSSFDTDPFEPQPQGSNTIFPFVVTRDAQGDSNSSEAGDGYVELPYTLPQDSTLFLVLREPGPRIWLQKLDWVAQHRGMALINVHPDYIRFPGEQPSSRNYPVEFYRDFLQYVCDHYGSSFWHPLPRELASFVTSLRPRPTVRPPKRVCMVAHSFYESDNRVIRYAETLVSRGDQVDVLALRRTARAPKVEAMNGVNVFRIQDRFGKKQKSRLDYLVPLLRFLWSASWWVTRRHLRRRYDLIHIHNVPDFLVFSAWYPKLTGTPVILDIHDVVPEFFASKFGIEHRGVIFNLLAWMERTSSSFADHIIIANHLWLDKYATRTKTTGRCTPFINHVDANLFRPRLRSRSDNKLVIVFPGGLQWHQGVDIALRAFQKVHSEIPRAEFHIYGDGSAKHELISLAADLGLTDSVRFFESRTVAEIASIIAQADLGVVPKRADSFGNEAYSTKIMEFMAVGVPVVVSSTKIDRYYFDDSVVRFFKSGDFDALASAILEVLGDSQLRQSMVARASEYAVRNSWQNRQAEYLNLVDRLCQDATSTSLKREKTGRTPSVCAIPPRNSAVRVLSK